MLKRGKVRRSALINLACYPRHAVGYIFTGYACKYTTHINVPTALLSEGQASATALLYQRNHEKMLAQKHYTKRHVNDKKLTHSCYKHLFAQTLLIDRC